MDCLNLLGKGLNATGIHDVAQEFNTTNTKNALLGIDGNAILAELLEYESQVGEVFIYVVIAEVYTPEISSINL